MLRSLVAVVAAATLAAAQPSFLAVGPSAIAGSYDFFQLSAEGAKVKVLVTFPIAAAETAQEGAFDCGRGYCLLLTQLPATKQSILRNFSFFTPALLGKYTLPFIASSLVSNEAENDDDFYGLTISSDVTTTPTTWRVVRIGDAGKVTTLLDITAAVGPSGIVPQGGLAYCGAGVSRLFVSVSRLGAGAGDTDSMLTIDIANKRLVSTLALNFPVLASHYATCGGSEGPLGFGGAMLMSSGPGRHAVVVGSVDQSSGAFSPIDAADVPAAGVAAVPLDITPVGAAVSPFSQTYSAVLCSGFNSPPCMLFVSSPAKGRGSATLAKLDMVVYGIAEMF